MSNEQSGPLSIVTNVDLSSATYKAVAIGASGLVLPSAGGTIIGVTQTKGAVGKRIKVKCAPGERTLAIAGGTVTFGEKLKVDASGRFVTASAQDQIDGKAVAWCYDGGTVDKRISVVLIGNAGAPTLAATETIADDADHVVATSAYTYETLVTLAVTNMTGALADGLYVGQEKKITVDSQAGAFTYVLTPATMKAGQPTSFTFTSAGQSVTLKWRATGWEVIDVKTAGIAAVATGGTINPLIAVNTFALAGAAEDRILPSGWCAGHTISCVISGDTGGDTTVSGLFYTTAGAATGVDLQMADAGDMATVRWDGARWFPIQLVSVTVA